MTTSPGRRMRKRLATRQNISDAATRLFLERGFDRVTVDEIAEAADVGRMTVFSHFPRKEDMFFDRDQDLRDLVLGAVARRDAGVSPLGALRVLVHRLVMDGHAGVRFSDGSRRFVETVAASETLRARARAIRDEVARDLTQALADAAGQERDDSVAALAANLVMATASIAFVRAHDAFRRDGDRQAAQVLFLALIDRGLRGVDVAMGATPDAHAAI